MEIFPSVFRFYEQTIHRLYRLRSFINRRKSLRRCVSRMKEMCGDKFFLAFGNHRRKQGFKCGIRTSVLKELKDTCMQQGIPIYLIDENLTSQNCSRCHHDRSGAPHFHRMKYCKTIMIKKKDINGKEVEKEKRVHGLLRCNGCGMYWDRDINAARNICKVAHSIIQHPNHETPRGFQRTSKQQEKRNGR